MPSMQTAAETAEGTPARKWSSILQSRENSDTTAPVAAKPEPQSNAHVWKEQSFPEISVTSPNGANCSSECLLLSGVDPAKASSISKMLELSLKWDKDESSLAPLSPLRSPVVADWKAVGSPIAAPNGANDALFDDGASVRPEVHLGREDAVGDRMAEELRAKRPSSRRQRAMSLIERTVFNPRKSVSESFDLDLNELRKVAQSASQSGAIVSFRDSLNSPNSTKGPFNGGLEMDRALPQIPQLPSSLHDDLGVGSVAEVTEIFKRSSMDSLTTKKSDECQVPSGKPLSCMPSLFGRMPFGPAAMVFGNFPDPAKSDPDSLLEPLALVFDDHQDVSPDATARDECFAKDYFGMESKNTLDSKIGEARRHPRRHSIATPSLFPSFDALNSHSSFSFLNRSAADNSLSSLSPSAAAFHFKGYSENSSPTLVDYMAAATSSSPHTGERSLYLEHQLDVSTSFVPMSAASLREAAFQLSSYKGPLYAVEFKAGRTEIFYVLEIDSTPQLTVKINDLVIVEADRGEDLGKVTIEISVDKLKQLMMPGSSPKVGHDKDSDIITPELAVLVHSKEIVPKRIHRLAQSGDLKLLQAKAQEEAIAMVRCQSRIRQKKLPMEVVDAEYQWDRNKLTFYFCADRRIDFRELVRDLFRIYKTRIWMCAVDKGSSRMLMYSSPCGSSVTSISAGGLTTSKRDLDSESLSFYSNSYCTSPI